VSVSEHISETARPIFTNFGVLLMATAGSSSVGVAIRYVGLLPVLNNTSFFA